MKKTQVLISALFFSQFLYAQEFDQDLWFKKLDNEKKISVIYLTHMNFYNSYKFLSNRSKELTSHILLVQSCLTKQQFGYAIQSEDKKLEKLFFDISFTLDKVNSGITDFKEGLRVVSKKSEEIDEYYKNRKLPLDWMKKHKFEIERFSHMTSIYSYACSLNMLEKFNKIKNDLK